MKATFKLPDQKISANFGMPNNKISASFSISTSDKSYVHEQGLASTEWTVNHNLGKFPAVSVIDSAGDEVICEVHYNDKNCCILMFNASFKGIAYLN